MSGYTNREYTITFNGNPSLREIESEVLRAKKIFGEWTRVAVETNGSSDPELVEVTFTLGSEG
jgi:hypothetical protein